MVKVDNVLEPPFMAMPLLTYLLACLIIYILTYL